MDPHGTLANLFDRIRRKLQIPHVFNPGLLDCALCGKRVATMHEQIMHKETDGVPLCRSCFELVLKKAAQAPEYRRLMHDSLNSFDEYLGLI
ncbi:MAG: hypothetical protein ABSG85_14595 [Spirochaetia bacterium]|jgi:hypothetical protein